MFINRVIVAGYALHLLIRFVYGYRRYIHDVFVDDKRHGLKFYSEDDYEKAASRYTDVQ